MYTSLPRPTIFGHRGASAHAPENTLAAFELALQHQADAIELDAKLSADGHVMVIHDQTVDRTTEGQGKVGELPLAELRKLDAGSFFDIAFKGECIPTLNEVFEVFGRRTLINVELTNYASPNDDLPDKVIELIQKHKLNDHILFSSFNPRALRRAHSLAPGIPCGLLALPGFPGLLSRSWFGRFLAPSQALHPEKSDVTPRLVQRTHQRGQRIHVWTVNDPAEMRRLFELGVDGIFTDDPRMARSILADQPASKSISR